MSKHPSRKNSCPLDASGVLSWVRFGDLHLATEHAQNYQDLLGLIAEVNSHLAGENGVNFTVLPGDNADNSKVNWKQRRKPDRRLRCSCTPTRVNSGQTSFLPHG